jgi:hypothetical protein
MEVGAATALLALSGSSVRAPAPRSRPRLLALISSSLSAKAADTLTPARWWRGLHAGPCRWTGRPKLGDLELASSMVLQRGKNLGRRRQSKLFLAADRDRQRGWFGERSVWLADWHGHWGAIVESDAQKRGSDSCKKRHWCYILPKKSAVQMTHSSLHSDTLTRAVQLRTWRIPKRVQRLGSGVQAMQDYDPELDRGHIPGLA